MDVIILQDSAAVADAGAKVIEQLLQRKADAVLGLATGSTPLAMYKRLIAACKNGDLSFLHVTTFNLDEYLGLPDDSPHSYRSYMNRELFGSVDINIRNTYLPCCNAGEDPHEVGPRFECIIRDSGGIDLQILGIGGNGHIGFNEPTSSLGSRTRIKTLARATVESNSFLFGEGDVQPRLAITMGIATIMDARKVVLLATGESKADAIHNSFEGPVSTMWPASALQMHEKVVLLLDEAAASRLKKRDYYDWVSEQKLIIEGAN